MSSTAVGVTTDLDGPLPVPRQFSLLRTPGVVVEEVAEGENPRWLNGVNVIGYPAGVPLTWEPCATGTSRVKESVADLPGEEDAAQPQARFDAIAVYFPLECTARDARGAFADRAAKALDATLSHGVEAAFAKGVFLSNNPFLGDTNLVALASGAAVKPSVGLGYLENAIGELTGRQGVIHSTPAVTAAWGYGSELLVDSTSIREVGTASGLRTRNGTPVISGSGYIGTDPVNETASGATTDWVFATGQVEVRIGDGPRMDIVESLDRTINLVTFRAERFVLAEWDTALQVGVLIDWSL